MPFYHPCYEEGLKPALRSICDAADSGPAGCHGGARTDK
jgi:hypothetical protein